MKITRCKECGRPLALNTTAWTCGPMFCSLDCGVEWAKKLYEASEYTSELDHMVKARAYFKDVAEEISREDFGARIERYTAYSSDYDISTIFESVYENDELVSTSIIGWYFGEPNMFADEEYAGKLTATFV